MIVANTNFHLYTAFSTTALDSLRAKKALDDAGKEYVHLYYVEEEQQKQVLESVSTWFSEKTINQFPFLVYDERHDDFSSHRKILIGAAEIISFVS